MSKFSLKIFLMEWVREMIRGVSHQLILATRYILGPVAVELVRVEGETLRDKKLFKQSSILGRLGH